MIIRVGYIKTGSTRKCAVDENSSAEMSCRVPSCLLGFRNSRGEISPYIHYSNCSMQLSVKWYLLYLLATQHTPNLIKRIIMLATKACLGSICFPALNTIIKIRWCPPVIESRSAKLMD